MTAIPNTAPPFPTPAAAPAFRGWAIVDVMGHQRYAGQVSETTIAGAGLIRVDVPEVTLAGASGYGPSSTPTRRTIPAFSKLFAPGAIHSISPCDEEIARAMAARFDQQPVQPFELRHLLPGPGTPGSSAPALQFPDDADSSPAGEEE